MRSLRDLMVVIGFIAVSWTFFDFIFGLWLGVTGRDLPMCWPKIATVLGHALAGGGL